MKVPAGIAFGPLGGSDLVGLAQCYALDASVFPHASLPLVVAGAPPAIWVAREDDEARAHARVVGFAATHELRDTLEMIGLAVDEAWRRRGIAGALVDIVAREAKRRRFRRLTLHVSTTNDAAIGLYEARRFARVRRLEGYYRSAHFGEGGAAWLMARDLRGVRSTG